LRRFWQSPLNTLQLPAEPQLEAFISLHNLRSLSDGAAEERYQQVLFPCVQNTDDTWVVKK